LDGRDAEVGQLERDGVGVGDEKVGRFDVAVGEVFGLPPVYRQVRVGAHLMEAVDSGSEFVNQMVKQLWLVQNAPTIETEALSAGRVRSEPVPKVARGEIFVNLKQHDVAEWVENLTEFDQLGKSKVGRVLESSEDRHVDRRGVKRALVDLYDPPDSSAANLSQKQLGLRPARIEFLNDLEPALQILWKQSLNQLLVLRLTCHGDDP